ncbi:MAG: insulinase family protein, partial [Chlorobiales bacterium]|nr:insulinase family protein [Chlorobiales bacterium]
HGKLDNGLSYYIRQNRKPEKRAELRLVVNAGSVLENDDQQGLAHFVEHMAFNGTEHFRKHELVNFLESVGVKFGPDINAYTGFDETVYMLEIPTDSTALLDKAFMILEDWAHGVSFDDDEIEKERGVVIEEWRSGRGAATRLQDKHFPILFKDSRYAQRLPIGQKSILETFKPEALKQFYKDWYRPDLMAVIAVGDFGKTDILKLINKHFGHIPAVKNTTERKVYDVPNHPEPLFSIATDPEATETEVSIYYKQENTDLKTLRDYRNMLIGSLYLQMFDNRLKELTRKAAPPFLYAYNYQGKLVRSKETYVLGANVSENGIMPGLETLLTEANRIKQYGFTVSELERQKKELLRSIEISYKEQDKTKSQGYVSEYTRLFLSNEASPGIEREYAYFKKFIPGIRIEEVNQLATDWIRPDNHVAMISAPKKEGVTVPTETELKALIDDVKNHAVSPYEDNVLDEPLVSSLPQKGRIVSQKKFEKLGLTEWKLSNGLRVILKPTDFKNDEVRFAGFSVGGSSLVPDKEYIPAVTASSIVRLSGIGNFDAAQLEKKLSGKAVSISPYINEFEEGLTGYATPDDLETLFQLCYLYFTSPRLDSTAYQSYISRLKGALQNRTLQPESAFQDTVQVTLAQYHFRQRVWTPAITSEFDLKKSLEIYRNRFKDASDFTFVFVGNISPDKLSPLVETYLGSLPATNRKESWKDNGVRLPKGLIEKQVRKGLEQKSLVSIIFSGPFEWSSTNRYLIQSLESVLEIKLREILREDKSGTYGVSVSAAPSRYPASDYTFEISFGCDPSRVKELTTATFAIIDSLKQTGIAPTYLKKVKENQRRNNETNLKENIYWLRALKFYCFYGEDPHQILGFQKLQQLLTAKHMQQAAKLYLNERNRVQVTLYPEQVQPAK